MRIAILSCFYPYRGGISQFNASMYNELAKEHSVAAFNFSRQYPDFLFPGKTQYVDKNDPAIAIESDRILDTANPFSYITTARKIRKWNPDLLVMRYWMPYFAPSQGWVARHMNPGTKVISILDNVISHEPRFFDKAFTKYYLKGNDAFMVLCNAVAEDLLELAPDAIYKVSPHPLYSHFGSRISREEASGKLGIAPDRKNILFFGLIREYKGLDILLKAFDMLDDSYQLIIAGEPYGSFEKYEKLIESSHLKGNISLHTRYIPDTEVSTFFSASDVCVLPYRTATQSGISSVSYHFEVPLITTDTGGLKETIGDRGTGMIIEDISPEAVSAAIRKYFNEPDMRDEYVRNIRIEKERLSWKAFCRNLTDLYNEIK